MPYYLLLLLVSWAVFGNSLGNGFVWDDNNYVALNSNYRSFNFRGVLLAPGNGVEYLPVRDLSYFIDNALWRNSPLGFHAFNCAIYSITSCLVFLYTRKVTGLLCKDTGEDVSENTIFAFLVALLFTVHPLHSEAVSWITQRNTLLAGLFFFASCNCYSSFLEGRHHRFGYYAASLTLFVLALFSKAIAIILPLFLAVTVLQSREKHDWRQRMLPLLPFALIALLAVPFFKAMALKSGIIPFNSASVQFSDKLAVAAQIPFFYLDKFAVPVKLSVDYGITFSGGSAARAASAVIVLSTVAGLMMRKRFPLLVCCGAWYLLLLLPVLNFFSTYPAVADRYAFLPIYPLCLLAVYLLKSTFLKKRRYVAITLCVCILSAYFAARRSTVFANNETIWSDAVLHTPRSARAHYELGGVYFRTGRFEAALREERIAQQLGARRYYDYFMGQYLLINNETEGALRYFLDAVEHDQGYIDALFNVGYAAELLGNRDMAIDYYLRALASREPDHSYIKDSAKLRLDTLGVRQ